MMDDDTAGRPYGVISITSETDRITDTALPRATTMTVVDADGKVLLHSGNKDKHEQSVFEDLRSFDVRELKAVFKARIDELLNVTYMGVPVRMHVRYLPGPNWYLLTYAPKALIDVPVFDMMVLSIVGEAFFFLVAFIAAVMGLVLFALFLSKPTLTWRPRGTDSHLYAGVGVISLILSIILCIVAVVCPALSHLHLLVIALLLLGFAAWPFYAGGTTAPRRAVFRRLKGFVCRIIEGIGEPVEQLLTRKRPLPEETDRRSRGPVARTYFLWCWGLCGVLVFAPVIILFSGAYRLVTQMTVKGEQCHYARQFEIQDGRSEPMMETRDTLLGEKFPIPLDAVKLENTADNDYPAAFEQESDLSPLSWALKLLAPLGSALLSEGFLFKSGALDTGSAVDSRGVAQKFGRPSDTTAGAPTPPYRTWHAQGNKLALDLNDIPLSSSAPGGGRLLRLTSVLPSLFSAMDHGIGLLLVIAGGLLTLVVMVFAYRSVKRFFFLDLLGEYLPAPGAVPPLAQLRNAIEQPAAGDGPKRDILINVSRRDLDNLAENGVDISVVTVLESLSAVERYTVQRAIETKKDVILATMTDPLILESTDEREAWARVLAVFRFHRLPAGSPAATAPLSDANIIATWADCTAEEKRILGQMTLDAIPVPHPGVTNTLRRLVDSAMLSPSTLDFAHPRIKAYVGTQVSAEQIAAWERAKATNTWDIIKAPLTTAVLLFFVVLGFVIGGPELAVTGVVAPTVAAGLPTVIEMLGHILNKNA